MHICTEAYRDLHLLYLTTLDIILLQQLKVYCTYNLLFCTYDKLSRTYDLVSRMYDLVYVVCMT